MKKRILSAFLACVLAFSLFVPVGAVCSQVEHVHSDACYQVPAEPVLICDKAEAHAHDVACYQDNLICDSSEGHVHGPDCYESALICSSPEHTHIDSCYGSVLSCDMDEHSHDVNCYDADGSLICELPEHMHADVCYDSVLTCSEVEHTHDEFCYGESTLICSLLPEHLHTDACYERQFVCGFLTAHTHDDTCYDENGVLICEEPEISEHVHTDDCYDFDVFELSSVPVCGLEEHVHTDACGASESEPVYCGMESHIHESSCYDSDGFLICDKTEHIHADTCYINPALLTEGKTVEINGQVYEVADFVSLTDYLLQAVIISDGVTYDLMAGDKFTGINIYKDIDVELQIRFQTNSAGEELNQLYFWKMDGICLDEPAVGELVNEEGVVYGNYFIDTDGTIYAVLNELGLTQSIIDWRLDFYAMWQKTEGGTVIIDMGNGNTVEIELDLVRAALTKEARRYDSGDNLLSFEWTSVLSAYDDVQLYSIEDTFSLSRYEDMTSVYLADNGLSCLRDLLTVSDFVFTYETESGEIVEQVIPDDAIVFSDDTALSFKLSYEFDEPVLISSGTNASIRYISTVNSDFYRYCMLYDVDLYRYDNDIVLYVDDADFSASSFAQFEGIDAIQKSYAGLDGAGNMDWTLAINYDGQISMAGLLVQDVLDSDSGISYILADSFYLYSKASGQLDALSVVECSSLDEFESIVTAPDGLSPVYVYENQFKWFVPEPRVEGETSFDLYYKTTASDNAIANSESANLAQIGMGTVGPFDYSTDEREVFSFDKTAGDLQIADNGKFYTTWTLTTTVYPNVPMEWVSFEEYMPQSDDESLVDSIITDIESGQSEKMYSAAEAAEHGFTVRIEDFSGNDITEDMLGIFYVSKSGSYDDLYVIGIGDKNHVDRHGGFDAQDFGYRITISFDAYLEGDSTTFYEHENHAVLYYTENYANLSDRESVFLPRIDNSDLYTKKLLSEELSDDGKTLTLTYRVRYNLYDCVTGEGYVFSDKIADTSFAKYRPGSLEVYWVDFPLSETVTYWSYENEDSPYFGETNLLKIDEDVEYRVDIDGVDYYFPYRMATIQSETDEGWSCHVPYFKRTSGFRFSADGTTHFYSPEFVYKVDVDLGAMNDAGIYSLTLKNTASVFKNDGSLDAVANHEFNYNNGALQKAMLQIPNSDNQYTAKYSLLVNTTSPLLDGFVRLDIIDEMSASMNLMPDSIIVESSNDGELFVPVSSDKYRLLYDGVDHRLTCSLDNSDSPVYYRISYSVQVIGVAGTTVSLSNRAYISGFEDGAANVTDTVSISESGGSAEGAVAKLTVKKYNADNLSIVLPGAEFRLDRVYNLSASDLEALSGDLSQDEILSYLDSIGAWTFTANGTTDENGEIHWVNNENGVLLPLDTLFRLTETSAPDGYSISEAPRYFYLSADNGGSAERHNLYIKAFDFLNYESTLFVENQKGNFELLKTDGDTGVFLEGAQFGLFTSPDCSADSLFMSSLDYGNGRYYFGDIGFNSVYYLKETKAPDNYILSDVVYTVTVSSVGTVSISPELSVRDGAYVIANKSADLPRLPDTGSSIGLFNHWSSWTAFFSGVCLVVLNWPRKKQTD